MQQNVQKLESYRLKHHEMLLMDAAKSGDKAHIARPAPLPPRIAGMAHPA